MLDGLDDIPWKDLRHAYGSAADVPPLLRALCGSPEQQDEALGDLYGNILHQGTVYEATSYAVPFLFEIAAEPTIGMRDLILGFIGTIAIGNSYLDVYEDHKNFSDSLLKKLEEELDVVRRVRLAVLQHVDVITRLLNDTVPMVRAGAVYILSRFREHLSRFGPLITQAILDESDGHSRAGMLWCLGDLRDDSPQSLAILEAAVEQTLDLRQAFAAAVALFRINPAINDATHSLLRQLTAATWFAGSFLSGVPWDFSGAVGGNISEFLKDISPDPSKASKMLLLLLKQGNGDNGIVHDLIKLNFPEENWREYINLTSIQRDVLKQIVETDEVWIEAKRLWWLVPDGAKKISKLTSLDVQKVREEMLAVLARFP